MLIAFFRNLFALRNLKSISCCECKRSGSCVCPPHNPTKAFRQHCEDRPWASECKIYED